ncbi:maleylpyruvate isomerase family mycothiol-dependent enzyme [Lentzea sp. NPDC005914]|uniref:maleylpyruvate isomerase family mycothiol-dependent enzyme n=1 Tax=Lentzea sp. NPDC005914 TaxID=3154572 RepID=UPI0033CDB51F
MHNALGFPDLLRLIDERSTAFRHAVSSAPSLDAQVPTCPDWTLYDLAQHIGGGRRVWAATVAAGPDATAKAKVTATAPREREALDAWLAESTRQLLDALREAGPDRGCWVGWVNSQSPRTCGAVARHQVQELAVHTYDAQVTVGDPQPLPEEVAVDGVDEFLHTCVATTYAWPHEPATLQYHLTEGPSWSIRFDADGARIGPVDGEADTSATTSASDFVLWFYGRAEPGELKLDGDPRVIDRLIAWEPA